MSRSRKTILIVSIISAVLIGAGVGSYFLVRHLSKGSDDGSNETFEQLNYPETNQTVAHGSLYRTTEGLVVLELDGSYAEMGNAHGILLGEYIKYSLEYIIAGVLGGSVTDYADYYASIAEFVDCSPKMHSAEIEGIYAGALSAGVDMFVPALQRDWTTTDLWVLNTVQDWNQYACSGLGAWASATNATLDGRTIVGRDLDFHLDPNGYVYQLHTIIVYHGNSSHNTVVTFTWPGIITALTGFNENGVWLSTDNSNGLRTEESGRTPMGICMRNFLEQEDGINVVSDALAFFLDASPYAPFLFLLGTNETVADPVVVLEGNDNEVIARNGSSEGHDYVYLTNHQRQLLAPVSCSRYTSYTQNFAEFTTTGDLSVSIDEVLFMLKDGGAGTSTIHCVVFLPSTLEFRVGYTRITDFTNENALLGGPDDPLLQQSFKLI